MFAYEQIYINDHMATAGAEGGWSDSQMKIFLIPGEKCISSTLWGTNYVQATDNLKHIFGFSVQRLLRSYWLIYTLIPLHQHLQPLMYSAGSCTPTNASLLKKKKKRKVNTTDISMQSTFTERQLRASLCDGQWSTDWTNYLINLSDACHLSLFCPETSFLCLHLSFLSQTPRGSVSSTPQFTSPFTFSLRLLYSLLHHDPVFPRPRSVYCETNSPGRSPPPRLSSWPPPSTAASPRCPASRASTMSGPHDWSRGARQEPWPGTRTAILGGPCPD